MNTSRPNSFGRFYEHVRSRDSSRARASEFSAKTGGTVYRNTASEAYFWQATHWRKAANEDAQLAWEMPGREDLQAICEADETLGVINAEVLRRFRARLKMKTGKSFTEIDDLLLPDVAELWHTAFETGLSQATKHATPDAAKEDTQSRAESDVWGKLKRALSSLHYTADGQWIDSAFSLKTIAETAQVQPTALQYQFRAKLYRNSDDTPKVKYERAVASGDLKKLLDATRDSGRVYKTGLPENT